MTSLLAFILPIGLMSVAAGDGVAGDANAEFLPENATVVVEQQPPSDTAVWSELIESYRPGAQEQVRIERRVIMRISPRASVMPDMTLPQRPKRGDPTEFEEQHMSKCVPLKKISNVKVANNNRLVLFMLDDRLVSAKLEKSCNARDFYSGFYVEKPEDGKICAGRDTIHSRAGVNCELSRFYRLVPSEP